MKNREYRIDRKWSEPGSYYVAAFDTVTNERILYSGENTAFHYESDAQEYCDKINKANGYGKWKKEY